MRDAAYFTPCDEVRRVCTAQDRDQFKEVLAAAALVVEPAECWTSSDPAAPAVTVRLPALTVWSAPAATFVDVLGLAVAAAAVDALDAVEALGAVNALGGADALVTVDALDAVDAPDFVSCATPLAAEAPVAAWPSTLLGVLEIGLLTASGEPWRLPPNPPRPPMLLELPPRLPPSIPPPPK
jgi:hypothetical protein